MKSELKLCSKVQVLVSSILPNLKLENVDFCPSLMGQNFFVRNFGDLKKTKSPFEIKWLSAALKKFKMFHHIFVACSRYMALICHSNLKM